MIDRIFRNLERLIDDYEDLPETIEAEDRFWKYVDTNFLRNKSSKEIRNFEKVFYDAGFCKEKQGFLYGFNYAVKLLGKYTE